MNRVSSKLVAGVALAFAVGCASAPKRQGPSIDPTLAQFVSSAQSAFALNSYDRAARFYQLALQRARALDDALEIGKQAYNLAASLHLAGRSSDALPFLDEAEIAFGALRRDTGPILLLRARALRAVGKVDEANQAVRRIVEMNTPRDVQAQAWLLYGQIALDREEGAEAEKALQRARSLASGDPALRAGIAGLYARLAASSGNPAGAAQQFDAEAEAFREAGRLRDMAESLARAGAAYQRAERWDTAGDRFYRAARSFYGQGDRVRALQTIEQALAIAEHAPDAAWGRAVAALFEEIRRAPSPAPAAEPAE